MIERGAGEVLTMAFDFRDRLIANIYLMINPDKLRYCTQPACTRHRAQTFIGTATRTRG